MSRDTRLFLEDIVACCDKVGRYTVGLTYEQFKDTELVIDAVARNLELIGEATKRVPEELRRRYEDVPWRKMAGLRDVIVHGYFGIDVRLLWDIVQRDVPTTRHKIASVLAVTFSK
jgi:uncharacterized protein with HEPN domain